MSEEHQEKKSKNVQSVLHDLSSDPATGILHFQTKTVINKKMDDAKINGAEAVVDAKIAYFMRDENIRFRHEGDQDAVREVIYLAAEQVGEQFVHSAGEGGNTVAVFYSASGSGKTVELAASSVTRGVDLTLITKIERDIRKQQIEETLENERIESESDQERDLRRIRTRNVLAFGQLRAHISALVTKYADSWTKILKAASTDGLKLVVALDEGATCPNLVRSIISNRSQAAERLHQLFPGIRVTVLFSIGGTCVAS
mmetsp:Transcript_23222/g.38462  ORF Transcript_23222/g.38462 Transcript_23222/m.38462 type:complete len:257 (+) Transcript_23222:130-900(+)